MNKLLIFLLGIFAAFSALIIQILAVIIFPSLSNFTSSKEIGYLILFAIFSEEVLKFSLIWKIFNNFKKQTNLFLDSFILGFGFAITEIVFNVFSDYRINLEVFLAYSGLLLIHVVITSFYGLYFFKKRNSVIWKNLPTFGIGLLVHFFFNLGVFYEINMFLLDSFLVIIMIILIKAYFLAKKEKIN